MAFETHFTLGCALDNVIGFVDRMATHTGQVFGFMYTGKPVHTVAGLVAIQANFIALLDRFTITSGHTDNTVTFSIKM